MMFWKKNVIREKLEALGFGFNRKKTDREQAIGNSAIEWHENGGAGIFVPDFQKQKGNPTYTGVLEAIDKPVYDTFPVVSASTTQYDLFQVPQGQTSKTAMETSQRQAGQLPVPEKFTIKRIGLFLITSVLADFVKLMNQQLFTFSVNSKIYTQGPLFYYPCGFGPFGQTTANDTSVITNGFPGDLGVRSLVYDIPLNPQDPFIGHVDIYGGGTVGARSVSTITLTSTTGVMVFMQGPYERAI
jgi:hypothetical protein